MKDTLPDLGKSGKLRCIMTDTNTPTAPIVRAQYEAYPYPTRNPDDERKRLIHGTPSSVLQIQHYIYGGKFPDKRPLRFLSAGGGTGDAAIMMAQQSKDLGLEVEVVHLDISTTSQGIARKRAEVRGLSNITFVHDSLLNAANYGPFDYIDCCGVLHHLDSPPVGLAALKAALTPEGGMGLMVYAPLGRTGVYPLQSALRRMLAGIDDPAQKVAQTKKILANLPPSNWLLRNELMVDHKVSDAGLYDLLLHSTDRSYTVMELADFVATSDLGIIAFQEKIKYDVKSYLKNPDLVALAPTDMLQAAALAEEIGGILYKHIIYVTNRNRAATAEAVNTPDMVPVYSEFDGVRAGKELAPGSPITGNLQNISVAVNVPRLAGSIMQRVDGTRTWRQVHEAMAQTLGSSAPSWDKFWTDLTCKSFIQRSILSM